MTTEEIYNWIDNASNDELLEINSYIVAKMKARRKEASLRVRSGLQIGDRVRIGTATRPLYLQGLYGSVHELPRGTSKVHVQLDHPAGKFRNGIVVFRSAADLTRVG